MFDYLIGMLRVLEGQYYIVRFRFRTRSSRASYYSHGARSLEKDCSRNAAEEQIIQPAASVRAYHYQIGFSLFASIQNLISCIAVHYCTGYGDIRVRSTPGKGSIFTFELPLPAVNDAIKPTQSRRVRGITFGQPTYRILVVDDVAENRLLLNKLLSPIGFQVREAVNGREACEVWSGWHPHLIWMDLRMPVMNGYAATRFIREAENKLHFDKLPAPDAGGGKAGSRSLRRPHTVIIALTASAFEHDRKGILEAGCDDFVTKPYREQTIFDKLTEHLGIQFIVENEAPVYVPPSETALTTERFAQLPPEWIAELNRALTLGDLMGARSIIDQISELDPDLADELRQKVKEYQFDEVFHLIERMQV